MGILCTGMGIFQESIWEPYGIISIACMVLDESMEHAFPTIGPRWRIHIPQNNTAHKPKLTCKLSREALEYCPNIETSRTRLCRVCCYSIR